MKDVVVRFAPSPTGDLHIGGVRTAIYNWLFARQHKGKFILRIEDTDTDRSTDESIEQILTAMKWLGMDWEEPVYRQTERLELYKNAVDKLLADGSAYYCYCSAEELEARRNEARAKKEPPRYNGKCRSRSNPPQADEKPVVRFKMPQEGDVVVKDMVRGDVVFGNNVLDDMIIMRSSGIPTYNLCVVVDDALMGVTHIFRGDDHLNNTPRQINIYKALGYELPEFAHLPMILGSDKARLSKRHGAGSVLEYRDKGFLPEAVINYMVRLGWSCGDQEIFDVPGELIEKFTTKNLSRSASIFNPEKMLWVNAQHIHTMDIEKLVALVVPMLKKEGLLSSGDTCEYEPEWLNSVFTHLKERSRTVLELMDSCRYFFTSDYEIEEKGRKKFLKPDNKHVFEAILAGMRQLKISGEPINKDVLEGLFNGIAEKADVKLGKIAQPARVALTGRTVSPGIYDVIELLGCDRVIERLEKTIAAF